MGEGHTPTAAQQRVGAVITVMAGVVAVTPVGLAIVAGMSGSPLRTRLLVAAGILWLVVVVLYRGLVRAHELWRRKVLRQEIAHARRARIEATDAFLDKLMDHDAILERIVDISGLILEDGIIDPHLALNNVRLIQSHAKDAQTQIDDAIIEAQVGIGAEDAFFQTVNLRNEIEEVVSPYAKSGISIATSGPKLYAETDPAMFRLVLRSLVTGATERAAGHIDVSVARSGDRVMCTVSDDGPDCARLGLDAVSALARSLADTMAATLDQATALGRNQFSITVPATVPEAEPKADDRPIDVLGSLRPSRTPDDTQTTTGRSFGPTEKIAFAPPIARDPNESVAARKEREILAG